MKFRTSEPSIRMGKSHEPLVQRTGAQKTLGRTLLTLHNDEYALKSFNMNVSCEKYGPYVNSQVPEYILGFLGHN